MRVLLITDWNRGSGGAERHAAAFQRALRAAGDETCLLTSSAGSAGDGEAGFVAFGTEYRPAQAFLQIANPFAAATVRRAVREFRPDAAWVNMFAHHLSPAAVFALGDVPAILLVSDYKCVCPLGSRLLPDGSLCLHAPGWVCHSTGCLSLAHWLRDQPRYALIRSALRRFRRIVTCSRWVAEELKRHGIESHFVPYMTDCVVSPAFRRLPAAQPVFLYIGRLDAEKGVALLLRAFARLHAAFPDARLRIIGRGPEEAALRRLTETLGLREAVSFPGWLSPEAMESHFVDAWAADVPSLWAEPLGLVAVEAILHHVPVIASAAGGLSEVVEPGLTGQLFPNHDESALLALLRAFADGSALPSLVLSESAVGSVRRNFDASEHAKHMRALFHQIASPKV